MERRGKVERGEDRGREEMERKEKRGGERRGEERRGGEGRRRKAVYVFYVLSTQQVVVTDRTAGSPK